jgi:hypothetical protein
MSAARAAALAVATVAAIAALALAGCGGGGDSTTGSAGTTKGAVASSRLTEKIGLVPIGGGRYRLGDCVATKVLSSPAAIESAQKSGGNVIVAPAGNLAIETGAGSRCVAVMKEALAFLNVP